MASEILVKVGTQIIFADHSGDWAGGAAKTSLEVGTPTEVQMDLASLANTNGWEGAKADLGPTRAESYSVMASLEFNATPGPTSGAQVDFYWASSPISTAANGNPMSIDGVDAAAPSGIGTLAELLLACDHIGSFTCTDDATPSVQTAVVGTLVPPERYGILIVVNESGTAMHSDAVECHVVFSPNIKEGQ